MNESKEFEELYKEILGYISAMQTNLFLTTACASTMMMCLLNTMKPATHSAQTDDLQKKVKELEEAIAMDENQ